MLYAHTHTLLVDHWPWAAPDITGQAPPGERASLSQAQALRKGGRHEPLASNTQHSLGDGCRDWVGGPRWAPIESVKDVHLLVNREYPWVRS